jgi:hypothetical protein
MACSNDLRKAEKIMETPAQIEFDGLQASPELQAAIEKHIAELESRFGRVTAGRVLVKGPVITTKPAVNIR